MFVLEINSFYTTIFSKEGCEAICLCIFLRMLMRHSKASVRRTPKYVLSRRKEIYMYVLFYITGI